MKEKKNIQKKIDDLIEEFKAVEDWNKVIPEFDEDALMVHWTNCGPPVVVGP